MASDTLAWLNSAVTTVGVTLACPLVAAAPVAIAHEGRPGFFRAGQPGILRSGQQDLRPWTRRSFDRAERRARTSARAWRRYPEHRVPDPPADRWVLRPATPGWPRHVRPRHSSRIRLPRQVSGVTEWSMRKRGWLIWFGAPSC